MIARATILLRAQFLCGATVRKRAFADIAYIKQERYEMRSHMEIRKFSKSSAVLDRSFCSYLDKKLEKFDINSSQHFYILGICESPGITQDTLIEMVCRDPSNVTRALAQLGKKGYLRKEHGKSDKRTFHLYPTEKANSVYEEIRTIVLESIGEVLEPLTSEERDVFLHLLEKTAMRAFQINKNKKEQTEEKGDETNEAAGGRESAGI